MIDGIHEKGESALNCRNPLIRRFSILSRRFISISLLVSMMTAYFLVGATSAFAAEANIQFQGKAAILMDAETGQVLYQYNPDEALPPASMAKMMTEYLVMKAIQEGRIHWDDVVTVQENAAKQIGSRVFLAKGDKHTVEELYKAMAIASANDATVQLAEYLAGSEQAFVAMMNETAKQLGMTNTYFVNTTGLERMYMPEAYRPAEERETLMSARDSAILAYHILKEMPEVLEITKIQSLKFRERDKDSTPNWNWMLESNKDIPNFRKFAYPGVDGLKTGHTDTSGNCFTGTALRNGTRLIAVVMGVPGSMYDGQRFLEAAKLFDYGFNNFEKLTVVEGKSTLEGLETVTVQKGKETKLPIATARDITILAPKGAKAEITDMQLALDQEPIVAPVKQGDKVGTASITYVDPATGETMTATVDMVAQEDVEKGSWWRLFFRAVGQFFSGLFKGIVNLF
jgi:D-alanyl-D-alanine carboxypeptidase (penicillin-binding protein 5/6)